MIPSRLIEAKRDGHEIPLADLRAFFDRFLNDELPEYQMAAFLMAVVFRGLSDGELNALVDTMLGSGEVLAWPDAEAPVVDKHSTGGVGDKVSLILAPLAAELGLLVPMMSGRGLGHSGGTLDKLESIPGFRTQLPLDEFRTVLSEVGCAMIGQTEQIAPLDKRLYALRNVTGTVPAIPLIASSIMSKKISEGLDALVLDVKHGSGAFLPDTEQALELARTMVGIGESHGVRTHALLTAMDRPLGRTAGNALEVREAIEVLQGGGDAELEEVTVALTARMLLATGLEPDEGAARRRCRDRLSDGSAARRFEQLIERQGGDPRVVADPDLLGWAPVRREVRASVAGTVTTVEPRGLGWAVVGLGGGRRVLDDRIDPSVGFEFVARVGDRVDEGDVLAIVHAAADDDAEGAEEALREAFQVGGEEADPLGLVTHSVTSAGVTEF